jgi:hypothetical protein
LNRHMTSDVEGTFRSIDATMNTSRKGFQLRSLISQRMPPASPRIMTAVTKALKMLIFWMSISTQNGITKTIVLDALVRIPSAGFGLTKVIAGFKISAVIKRTDYKLGSGFANMMLGDEITLTANGGFVIRSQLDQFHMIKTIIEKN